MVEKKIRLTSVATGEEKKVIDVGLRDSCAEPAPEKPGLRSAVHARVLEMRKPEHPSAMEYTGSIGRAEQIGCAPKLHLDEAGETIKALAARCSSLACDKKDLERRVDQLDAELSIDRASRDRYRQDYENACELVAKMHAAAVGAVQGPKHGVVEDVAALHKAYCDTRMLLEQREGIMAAAGDRIRKLERRLRDAKRRR